MLKWSIRFTRWTAPLLILVSRSFWFLTVTEQAPQLLFLAHKFFSIYWNSHDIFNIMNLSSLTCSHNLMVLKLSWIESRVLEVVLDRSWNWNWNWTCVAKVNPRIRARGNRGKLSLKCINEWILNETMNEIMNFSDFLSPYQIFNTSCVRAPKLPAMQPPLSNCSAGQYHLSVHMKRGISHGSWYNVRSFPYGFYWS